MILKKIDHRDLQKGYVKFGDSSFYLLHPRSGRVSFEEFTITKTSMALVSEKKEWLYGASTLLSILIAAGSQANWSYSAVLSIAMYLAKNTSADYQRGIVFVLANIGFGVRKL